MHIRLVNEISVEQLAEDISSQLDHDSIVALFVSVLDQVACVEVDEALTAKLWRGIQECYGDDETPTLDGLLKRYAATAAV